jgi:hypothetical protein
MFPLAFLVLVAQWTHFDSIPNSIVKRCGGEDTWGVAPWDNSSVPGSLFSIILKTLIFCRERVFAMGFVFCVGS